LGGGLGADYLRRKGSSSQPELGSSNSNTDVAQEQAAQAPPPPPDAAALGLLSGKAKDVQLSPIKRKRANTPSSSGGAAIGWGGALTKELGRMRDGESFQPVRKKTRFVTAKGIREAGRESFGGDAVISAVTNVANDDDDDDDLDIVRE
jgi:minichromosome maintenance protein 10